MSDPRPRLRIRWWHVVLIVAVITLQIPNLIDLFRQDRFETEAFGFPQDMSSLDPVFSVTGRGLLGLPQTRPVRVTFEGQDAILHLDELQNGQTLVLAFSFQARDASNTVMALDLEPTSSASIARGGLVHRFRGFDKDFVAFVVDSNNYASLLRFERSGLETVFRESHRRDVSDGSTKLAFWSKDGTTGLFLNDNLYHSFKDESSEPGAFGLILSGQGSVRIRKLEIYNPALAAPGPTPDASTDPGIAPALTNNDIQITPHIAIVEPASDEQDP